MPASGANCRFVWLPPHDQTNLTPEADEREIPQSTQAMLNPGPSIEPSDEEALAFRPRLFEVLLIFLVFFALAGDPAPHQNEPYYLCRLKHFWNPAWCAGDFYLDSADAHFTFVLAFGWLTKWLSLSATAWTGRIFVWTLLAWAWQRLSWRIVPKPFFSVLSAALWVVLTDRGESGGRMGRRRL